MSDAPDESIGTPGWIDLTVEDAPGLRDFYAAVVGWKTEEVPMGDYADFTLLAPATGEPKAGICHARGSNADFPPVWMVYFLVADVEASVAQVLERGGACLLGPKNMGSMGRYAVIRDPAGAICALFETAG